MFKTTIIVLCLILWPLNYLLSDSLPKLQTPETIFTKDYEAEQLILRNTQLYPTIIEARLFQNKGRIYLNKFTENFFALSDPNYYFFGLHPRPIVPDNKNLFKYPFVAIVFFFYGILEIGKFKYRKILLILSVFLLTSLSILKNFDGYDIILWFPVSSIIVHGINSIKKNNKRLFMWIAVIFLIFALPEIIRSFYAI